MKPLTKIDEFLKRFDNFKDAELRSVEVISPTTMLVTLAAQDSARGFDWVSVKLEFTDVSDAKLLDSSKLSFVDMSDGITVIKDEKALVFGIGECYNLSAVKNAICYILSSTIKYEEGLF